MNETNLVGVHKARVAHHVAAVGQIDRQHRSAAVLDCRRAVIVQLLVVVRLHVAAGEERFDMLEKLRVDRHHVFEMAVVGTFLDHPDLAVALDDLSLDLADFSLTKVATSRSPLRICSRASITHFGQSESVCTRKAKRRLRLLPRFQDRLVSPLRGE